MDYNFIQVLLIFIVTFIAAIDQFSFLESLYQPIVTGPIIGAILGDVQTGLVVGGTYQLMTIGNMPVGGAQPPNAVIGGIMATVFAIVMKIDATASVGFAVAFALIGQYIVTIVFTVMSPIMEKADEYAHKADPKGIEKINYGAMTALGVGFGLVVVGFFLAGSAFGEKLSSAIPDGLMRALGAAGGMMRYVGFATLLRVMMSKDMWGFYFMGFALALVIGSIEAISGATLLLIAFIGFGFAFWDYQVSVKTKANEMVGGDFSDGI
ncbi:MAG: PTS sugar transporter subunit IIC [Peptoniphilaceae bacterium]|nr:PTS sugar transporter subunit IIC [Peptoniphilaceae bacterium]MDD7383947.1 PTS sugar transporter subunit IIC [Peptoniphilaceae bacterium]MDY3738090.1 PTS sugar transporter subunit IIC [Peptoniphilaceae bacterium]